jgi:demethylmenaquinone methyltransferase/2-methoxy-6-polyprenyl-1,4-benzoquinol methylase
VLPERVERATARGVEAGFTMSCDPSVGRLLSVLAAATPPNGRILELGTGCGVGLAWIVDGLAGRADVEVTSIEFDHAVAEVARRSDWPRSVSIVEADAVEVFPSLGGFDLVFADAQGGKWDRLDLTIAAVRPRGVLVVDDMTPLQWESDHHRTKTEEVRERLLAHPDLVAVELAPGSGVILCTRRD